MRTAIPFTASADFEQKLLQFISTRDFGFCFKGNGWGATSDFGFKSFAGFDALKSIDELNIDAFNQHIRSTKDFIISHLTYDVKNELESLSSENVDFIEFPSLKFTQPKFIFIQKEQWELLVLPEHKSEADQVLQQIESTNIECSQTPVGKAQKRLSKDDYLAAIKKVKEHIQRGDIYQANFCQEFFWTNASISPAELFHKGFQSNPNPFSVYYKTGVHHCISFSPERFIAANGRQLISQPMKGTAARGATKIEDQKQIEFLKHSEKDRRENVMIVDMVRNDLSHFATEGSVKVPELYKIETYPKVHQMYSTVVAQLKDLSLLPNALFKSFPMGSMTGAPKVSAMKIIEELEHTKRGIFSGTIGFFTPDDQADFNVVIRSLVYNENSNYLSCHVGGGITIMSDSEAEYEECLVKFKPIEDLIASL